LFQEIGLLDHDEDAFDVRTVLRGGQFLKGFPGVIFAVLAD
jgi:hypothetical protein